jgi:hypothetical protein
MEIELWSDMLAERRDYGYDIWQLRAACLLRLGGDACNSTHLNSY